MTPQDKAILSGKITGALTKNGMSVADACETAAVLMPLFSEVTDEMVVAARSAIYARQRSLIASITKSSIRDALEAAERAR